MPMHLRIDSVRRENDTLAKQVAICNFALRLIIVRGHCP